MGYTYDITTSKRDNTSSNCLFACHTLDTITTLFVSTFLVAYIYQFSKNTFEYIFNVGIYYISLYAVFLIAYLIFSYITDLTNRIWIYRLGQLIRLVFVVSIIFFGQELAQMLYLAGGIYGISEACYYASYNVLKQEMVSRKVMNKFSVFITISGKCMDIIVPITLGALISISTYEQASIYVAVIIALILILSFFVKAKRPENSNFSLKNYFKVLKEHPDAREKIFFMYKVSIVHGFTTITSTLLNVCIMLQFGSSFSLGSITSIISAVTIVELVLVTRFTKPAKRDWLYYIVMFIPLFSSILFTVYPSVVTVIVFNLLMMISKMFYTVVYDMYRNSTLKEAGLYSEIAEHQTVVEVLLAFFRVVSFAVMIVVGLLKNLLVFKILLVVFSLSYSATNLGLMLYEKKFLKASPEGIVNLTPREQEQEFQRIIQKLKKNSW